MFRFSLVRRRQVWLPTFAGWLVLVVSAAVASAVAARLIHPFLALNDPAPGARLLVVEGWLDMKELDQAVEAFRQGRYEKVVTTGGPIDRWSELSASSNYADLAAAYLKRHGLESIGVTAIPAPASDQDRTYLSAIKLRDWTAAQGLEVSALDVFSGGTHARRSRMLYRQAFGPNVDVGVMAARSAEYDAERWWRTSAGVKSVLDEAISLAWTGCCFLPAAAGSRAK